MLSTMWTHFSTSTKQLTGSFGITICFYVFHALLVGHFESGKVETNGLWQSCRTELLFIDSLTVTGKRVLFEGNTQNTRDSVPLSL